MGARPSSAQGEAPQAVGSAQLRDHAWVRWAAGAVGCPYVHVPSPPAAWKLLGSGLHVTRGTSVSLLRVHVGHVLGEVHPTLARLRRAREALLQAFLTPSGEAMLRPTGWQRGHHSVGDHLGVSLAHPVVGGGADRRV